MQQSLPASSFCLFCCATVHNGAFPYIPGSRIVWGIADPVDGHSSSQIETVSRVLPHLRQYVRVRSALVDAGALGTSVAELLGKLLGHPYVTEGQCRYTDLVHI